jgi:hypothetical protein
MTSKKNFVVKCPVKINHDTETAITIHLDESNVVASSSADESDDSSDHVPLAEIRLLPVEDAETEHRSIAAGAATIAAIHSPSRCTIDNTVNGIPYRAKLWETRIFKRHLLPNISSRLFQGH